MAFSIRSFFGKDKTPDPQTPNGVAAIMQPNSEPAAPGSHPFLNSSPAGSPLFKTAPGFGAPGAGGNGQPVSSPFSMPGASGGAGTALTVGDILPLLPKEIAKNPQLPASQPLQIPEDVLERALGSGQAALPLFEIYRVCPALFQMPVSPQDPRSIPLPPHKIPALLPRRSGGPASSPFAVAEPQVAPASGGQSPLFSPSPFGMAEPVEPAPTPAAAPPPANANPFQPAGGSPFFSAPAMTTSASPFAPAPTAPTAPAPSAPTPAAPASPFGNSPFQFAAPAAAPDAAPSPFAPAVSATTAGPTLPEPPAPAAASPFFLSTPQAAMPAAPLPPVPAPAPAGSPFSFSPAPAAQEPAAPAPSPFSFAPSPVPPGPGAAEAPSALPGKPGPARDQLPPQTFAPLPLPEPVPSPFGSLAEPPAAETPAPPASSTSPFARIAALQNNPAPAPPPVPDQPDLQSYGTSFQLPSASPHPAPAPLPSPFADGVSFGAPAQPVIPQPVPQAMTPPPAPDPEPLPPELPVEPMLKMPLATVLRDCTVADIGIQPDLIPSWVQVNLSLALVKPQLGGERIRIPLSDVMRGLEPEIRHLIVPSRPDITLELPVNEVFHALPAGAAPQPPLAEKADTLSPVPSPLPEMKAPTGVPWPFETKPPAPPSAPEPAPVHAPLPASDLPPLGSPFDIPANPVTGAPSHSVPSPFLMDEPAPAPPPRHRSPEPAPARSNGHDPLLLRVLLGTGGTFDAAAVVRHTAALPGVLAAVGLHKGHVIAAEGTGNGAVDDFLRQAPRVLEHLQPMVALTGIPDTETFSLKGEAHTVTFSLQGEATLGLLTDPAAQDAVLTDRVTLIAREFAALLRRA